MLKPDQRTEKRKLGDIGENLACEFLKRRGFEILDRNYLKKWGELDIVARIGNVVHFVEVKSVSAKLHQGEGLVNVPHETQGGYRPEDNMHPWKLKRLARTMQTYLLDKKIDLDFQLDLITVKIDEKERKGRVEILENIVI